ncbi:MAG: DNA-directed RNA polymerase subunit alpha [Bacteroidales bacterium]
MAILAFQKPDQVIMLDSDDRRGKFEFRPLEPGYGITVGNALRRILLSSLEGYAITSVKIEGVDHEFSSIKGVLEDVTDIILNLKQVRFANIVPDSDEELVNLTISGKETFTGADIETAMSNFKVLNPELLICTLEKNVTLNISLTINKGRGYVPSAEHELVESEDVETIAIDSIYTPIKNVKYSVENYRVEQKTDYERLLIEIDTDGSINPKDALKEAAKILIHHFMLFSDEKITLDNVEEQNVEEFDEELLEMRRLLKKKLVDFDLSVRALNCLKAAEVVTLGELVQFQRGDLLKFRNFGKKSLTELDELLESLKLSFGLDISKYKLDKE